MLSLPGVDAKAARPPGLVDRDFVADDPDQLWVVDLIYVAAWCGFGYVCFVTDVFSRRVGGVAGCFKYGHHNGPRRVGDGPLGEGDGAPALKDSSHVLMRGPNSPVSVTGNASQGLA